MAKLSIDRRGNVNALQLSTAQAFRQSSAVQPIGFDSLPWSSRDHRRCRHQTVVTLGRQPIIQSVPRRSSLIDERNLLIGIMLAYVLEQVLHIVRHVQRSHEPLLVITKRHRDTSLVYVQPGKHIVLLWYKRLLPHTKCLLAQCLWLSGIVAEHSRSESTSIIQVSGQSAYEAFSAACLFLVFPQHGAAAPPRAAKARVLALRFLGVLFADLQIVVVG